MLTNIGGRNQDFSQRYRVIRQEVELEELFGIRISVDDASNVDYQTNGLFGKMIRARSGKQLSYEQVWQCNLNFFFASDVDIHSGKANDVHAGAAFPAKKTTRRLTLLRSEGFIFFNNKYLYRDMSDININTDRNCLHV